MNRTGIEWADYTWNPITGCLGPGGTPGKVNRCWYCYARNLANGRLKALYLANPNVAAGCDPADPFSPRFWPERLDEPGKVAKPSRIFVCSMGDLFYRPCLPFRDNPYTRMLGHIDGVMRGSDEGNHHTYIMLTKNPQNIPSFPDVALPWVENQWLGISASTQAELGERWAILAKVNATVRFVSAEPLLGTLRFHRLMPLPDWVIFGGLSHGKIAQPLDMWEVQWTFRSAHEYDIPVFVKNNLAWAFPGQKLPREFPNA